MQISVCETQWKNDLRPDVTNQCEAYMKAALCWNDWKGGGGKIIDIDQPSGLM
jgi:hypothetical protein